MILAVGLQIQIVYGRQIMFQRQFTATGPPVLMAAILEIFLEACR